MEDFEDDGAEGNGYRDIGFEHIAIGGEEADVRSHRLRTIRDNLSSSPVRLELDALGLLSEFIVERNEHVGANSEEGDQRGGRRARGYKGRRNSSH